MRRPLSPTVVLLALPVLGLWACAATGLPAPGAPDATRAQTRWPSAQLGDLERGRELYLQRCSGCHQPVPPSEHTADEWPALIDAMAERAELAGDERTLVEQYVITMSEAGR